MNNDLISREALKKAMDNKALDLANGGMIFIESINHIIDNAPTVEGRLMTEKELDERDSDSFETGYIKGICEQRPQGKWIYNQYDANPKIGNWHCSICHSICSEMKLTYDNFNFCPNCGARMKKGGD